MKKDEITMEVLMRMKLHEELYAVGGDPEDLGHMMSVLRVPGGWIYRHSFITGENYQTQFTCTFVPMPLRTDAEGRLVIVAETKQSW